MNSAAFIALTLAAFTVARIVVALLPRRAESYRDRLRSAGHTLEGM